MKKIFSVMLVLGSILSICSSAAAMDFALGQNLVVEDSSKMIVDGEITEGAYYVLRGAEVIGVNDSMISLKLKMFFTEADLKDQKSLGIEEKTYRIIVKRVESLKDVEGLRVLDSNIWQEGK